MPEHVCCTADIETFDYYLSTNPSPIQVLPFNFFVASWEFFWLHRWESVSAVYLYVYFMSNFVLCNFVTD